jgi:cobalt/nickel transport system permease protein
LVTTTFDTNLIELSQVNLLERVILRSTGDFMHIMEGYLSPMWCIIWWIIATPCLLFGTYQIKKVVKFDREALPLLGVTGGFIFLLSSLKLPNPFGSSSHPTGTGLSAICFGPWITSVICAIVLLFQSLLLAHGGLSTLGANIVSMGIIGPFVGYMIYRLLKDSPINIYTIVFLVTALADLSTYVVTSFQLALGSIHPVSGDIGSAFIVYLGIFAIPQIFIAILEGIILSLVFKYILTLKPEILIRLKIFSEEKINASRDDI